jgi:general bacterial porin, GBP family
MKKLLIAAAAMSVVAGAQAQSSVEVYGLIDQGYNKVESSGTTTQKSTTVGAATNSGNGSGNLNGSRLGFRGTEDLGGGNKAGFVAEYGLNLTGAGTKDATAAESYTGQTIAVLRQGYVSLTNASAGTLIAGTVYAFHDGASGALGGAQAHGGTNNTHGAANLLKYGATAGNPRATNAVVYVSPSFNGLTAKIAKHEGEQITTDAAPTKTNQAMSYALDYVSGKLKAGFAQTNYKDLKLAETEIADVFGDANDASDASVTAMAAGNYNVTNRIYGGSYNFGFATIGLNHADYQQKLASNEATNLEASHNSLSISVPVTAAFTINAAYTDGKIEKSGVKAYDTNGTDLIGVYTLSKRTNVYAMYTEATYDNATAGGKDTKQKHYGVGVRHSF